METQRGDLVHQQRTNLALFSMPSERFLGVEQLAVDFKLEPAATAGNHRPAGDQNFQTAVIQNFVHQPDGAWGIVSGPAVSQRDF